MTITKTGGGPLAAFFNSLVLCAGLIFYVESAAAQALSGPQSYIVGTDRGGPIAARAQAIERLRQSGTSVAIKGDICYSACTMYLGAGKTCVSPHTIFGFHGPTQRNGDALPQRQFEHFSQLMARYYPAALKQWFLSTGRYLTADVYRMRGSDLVAMGVAQC